VQPAPALSKLESPDVASPVLSNDWSARTLPTGQVGRGSEQPGLIENGRELDCVALKGPFPPKPGCDSVIFRCRSAQLCMNHPGADAYPNYFKKTSVDGVHSSWSPSREFVPVCKFVYH